MGFGAAFAVTKAIHQGFVAPGFIFTIVLYLIIFGIPFLFIIFLD